jgi:N-acylneuraminate cytidylyltransferase
MKSIAIIPARGGSKRIPRKNIRLFHGKPIIGYAIETALASNLFSKVIVTTDDKEIAEVAESFGASCEWIRSKSLSDDLTPTIDVIQDSVKRLWADEFDYVCCIYPTTPLMKIEYLIEGLNLIKTGGWDYVISAKEVSRNLFRSFYLDKNDKIQLIFPSNEFKNTQDFLDISVDAGQFYWGKRSSWQAGFPILTSKSTFVTLNANDTVDIDSESDWILAEKLYKESLNSEEI